MKRFFASLSECSKAFQIIFGELERTSHRFLMDLNWSATRPWPLGSILDGARSCARAGSWGRTWTRARAPRERKSAGLGVRFGVVVDGLDAFSRSVGNVFGWSWSVLEVIERQISRVIADPEQMCEKSSKFATYLRRLPV